MNPYDDFRRENWALPDAYKGAITRQSPAPSPVLACSPTVRWLAMKNYREDYTESITNQLSSYYAKFPKCHRLTEDAVKCMIRACNTPDLWKSDPENGTREVNCVAGQVRQVRNGKLLYWFGADGYVRITNGPPDVRGTHPYYSPRARIILRVSGAPPNTGDTADHINSKLINDDRMENLRWASKKEQYNNQKRPASYNVGLVRMLEISQDDWLTTTRLTIGEAMERFNLTKVNIKNGLTMTTYSTKNLHKPQTSHGFLWRYYKSPDEEWKPLTSVYGQKVKEGYEVSSLGRMKSPFFKGVKIGCLLPNGYRISEVTLENGKRFQTSLHIFICIGFHGDRTDTEYSVDHINRDITNNMPTNLRWATRQQQMNNTNRTLCRVPAPAHAI